MGHSKLQYGIKGEEPSACASIPNVGALACMINSEVGAVLAVMRRNVHWAECHLAGDDQLEQLLIQNLKGMRKQIFAWKLQGNMIDPVVYLQPFLDVIQSDETGAPITGVALSSVYKILAHGILDLSTVNVVGAMHSIIHAVTSCRFEVTDATSEEVVLMKILQVLLACMKSKTSVLLHNQQVCSIVNTCFQIVHQAGTKSELLQRIARHTMHELIRCIFSHLSLIDPSEDSVRSGKAVVQENSAPLERSLESNDVSTDCIAPPTTTDSSSNSWITNFGEEMALNNGDFSSDVLASDPYGIPCMVEILHYVCSLLNYMNLKEMGSRPNPIVYDEDIPLFALGLINSAIELGGYSIQQHPKLLSLIQDELFWNLMHMGLSTSSLILSIVCSIVLNLYHYLRSELKLQIEAFFSCVVLRLSENRYGSSYQQQEVLMEALVDFCRQKHFMAEMYANLDCEITSANIFEDLVNLLSKSAFPVNSPLSAFHVLALDGLIAVIQSMAERFRNRSPVQERTPISLEEYSPFWTEKCCNYDDPSHWVSFVRQRKYIKTRLSIGAGKFNRNPKKGLEFLQGSHLFPDKLDPQSVACFLRYTSGLDKNRVGDLLGDHDEFSVQVLQEFANTFDFQGMSLDAALRLFLESFRLPGESQKIQRVLEAFSERYYEQSPHIFANKDVAFILSYSLILLNTDQHNIQVKKKMTEEDFICNNRQINCGNDLPREFLSELYHSICENEIRTTPEKGNGFSEMTPSRWADLMLKSKRSAPFILCDDGADLDRDMFAIMSGPTIAAISVVFNHTEQEDVFNMCLEGFLAIAEISACFHLGDVLDDLVVSLCTFTTLVDERVPAFGDDVKARMSTEAVFTIANLYGDYIRSGWRNILYCILRLHQLELLPACVAMAAADDLDLPPESAHAKPLKGSSLYAHFSSGTPRWPSGLMGRLSQLLSLDTEEPRSEPTEKQLAAHQQTLQTIQRCHIESIFTESKFFQADSLLHLAKALIWIAGRPQKDNSSSKDKDTRIFCLELLIAIALNNRDRIVLLWQVVYEHIASIVQSTMMPCALVEKAVFGLLHICQRLLPYKEHLADELLKSLQLILKLDARVADAYCENITQEVMRLVKANATHIRSQVGWQNIISLLSITARHPEASEAGFESLLFIMSDGAHLTPGNFVLCVDACRQFAESGLGHPRRSMHALDLMTKSAASLVRWSREIMDSGEEILLLCNEIREMWFRLIQGLKKVCLDQREEIRNHAVSCLQRCLVTEGISFTQAAWLQCFDQVIFTMHDDLLKIAQSRKDYKNIEGTLVLALKLLSKVFLHLLVDLSQTTSFCKLWLGVLSRMEGFLKVKMKSKKNEKLPEIVPELLKDTLLVMKTKGVLTYRTALGRDGLWEVTWNHVKNISPSLLLEVFPELEHSEPRSTSSVLVGDIAHGHDGVQVGISV